MSSLKLRNLFIIILALAGVTILLEQLRSSNTNYYYAIILVIIITPFILIGYSAFTKRYRGEWIVLSLILSVIGSFSILYLLYFMQGTSLHWGIPIENTVTDYAADQLLFGVMVRTTSLLTIVYGMYFSLEKFSKKNKV